MKVQSTVHFNKWRYSLLCVSTNEGTVYCVFQQMKIESTVYLNKWRYSLLCVSTNEGTVYCVFQQMKVQSTVYFNKLNHKKCFSLKNLNIDTKIILQNAIAEQGYCAKKTGQVIFRRVCKKYCVTHYSADLWVIIEHQMLNYVTQYVLP
jgi:hypothetical protein